MTRLNYRMHIGIRHINILNEKVEIATSIDRKFKNIKFLLLFIFMIKFYAAKLVKSHKKNKSMDSIFLYLIFIWNEEERN